MELELPVSDFHGAGDKRTRGARRIWVRAPPAYARVRSRRRLYMRKLRACTRPSSAARTLKNSA